MSAPFTLADAIVCAWLLGGHTWRGFARYDWTTGKRTILHERCSRCHLTRPLGGYFGAIRGDLGLAR